MFEALKYLIFLAALGAAVFSRRWSLAVIAFFLPLSKLLPGTSISGLNALNMLLLPVIMHSFLAPSAPKPPGSRDPISVPVVIFLVLVFGSLIRVQFSSENPVGFVQNGELYKNVLFFKGMIVPLLLYFCARRLITDRDALRFAVAGALAGYLVQASSGALDFLRGSGLEQRAGGYFGHSGELGHFLAAYAMIPAAALLHRTRGLLWGALVALALSIMGILGSLSRGALLAFGVGLTSMAVVKRSVWVLTLVVLASTSVIWLPQNYRDRFNESVTKDHTGLSSVPGFRSVEEFDIDRESRIRIWRAGMRMIADNPVFGVGLGRYPYSLQKYGYAGTKRRSAHNVPLGLAAECGLPTALAHLAIVVIVGLFAMRLARTGEGSRPSTLGLGIFGATVVFAASGMVIPEFYRGSYSGAYFILAAAVMNLYFGGVKEPTSVDDENEAQDESPDVGA